MNLENMGFNMDRILKNQDLGRYNIVLVIHSSLNYFSKGRANMRVKTTYDVVAYENQVIDGQPCAVPIQGLYNFTSKREALKAFKEFVIE